jgi:NTE family protein
MNSRFALLFTGGGARSAYQVGVLSGLKRICDEEGIAFPFKTVTGYSGGAINAAYIASRFDELDEAIPLLEQMWKEVRSEQIYRSDFSSVARTFVHWGLQLTVGKFLSKKSSRLSLLEATPLMTLLTERVNFPRMLKHIRSGILEGVAVSAFNYSTGINEIFYQSSLGVKEWQGSRRVGINVPIGLRHVMASASIPVIFPSVKIKTDFYGDGSLRNYAPLSPALHLGANKIFVIGVVKTNKPRAVKEHHYPSLVRILGMVLNAALLDASHVDYQVSQRINELMHLIPHGKQPMKMVDIFMMSPSQDLGEIAMEYSHQLPKMIKYLLREMGTKKEGADILSYLLFTPDFNKAIIKLGKQDIKARRDEVVTFLKSDL